MVREMFTLARDLWHDESGSATFDTAIMLALVAAVAALAWHQLGHDMRHTAHDGVVAASSN